MLGKKNPQPEAQDRNRRTHCPDRILLQKGYRQQDKISRLSGGKYSSPDQIRVYIHKTADHCQQHPKPQPLCHMLIPLKNERFIC